MVTVQQKFIAWVEDNSNKTSVRAIKKFTERISLKVNKEFSRVPGFKSVLYFEKNKKPVFGNT